MNYYIWRGHVFYTLETIYHLEWTLAPSMLHNSAMFLHMPVFDINICSDASRGLFLGAHVIVFALWGNARVCVGGGGWGVWGGVLVFFFFFFNICFFLFFLFFFFFFCFFYSFLFFLFFFFCFFFFFIFFFIFFFFFLKWTEMTFKSNWILIMNWGDKLDAELLLLLICQVAEFKC